MMRSEVAYDKLSNRRVLWVFSGPFELKYALDHLGEFVFTAEVWFDGHTSGIPS